MMNRLGSFTPFRTSIGKVSPSASEEDEGSDTGDGMAAFYLSPPSSPPLRNANSTRSNNTPKLRYSLPVSTPSPHPARDFNDDDYDNDNNDYDNDNDNDNGDDNDNVHAFTHPQISPFPSIHCHGYGDNYNDNNNDDDDNDNDNTDHDDDNSGVRMLSINHSGALIGNRSRTRTFSDDYDVARTITALELSSGLDEALDHLTYLSSLVIEMKYTSTDRAKLRSWLKHYQFNGTVRLLQERWLSPSSSSSSSLSTIWNECIQPAVDSINNYVSERNFFDILPEVLVQEIFSTYLPLDGFPTYLCLNKEFQRLLVSDAVWKPLYLRKFKGNESTSLTLKYSTLPCQDLPQPGESFRDRFICRLEDPEIGDKVEVAWKGKFRLESTEVYQGLAWWVAQIVDKHSSQSKYKINYPGWESRWDEWVSRSRFRWLVEQDIVESISPGDPVELWCCGVNVPGAWLEAKVDRLTSDGHYELGRVSVSGQVLKVPRQRLRLVSHKKRTEITNNRTIPPSTHTHALQQRNAMDIHTHTQAHTHTHTHTPTTGGRTGSTQSSIQGHAYIRDHNYQHQHQRRLSARLEQQQHGYNGGVNVDELLPRTNDDNDHSNTKACSIM